MLLRSPILSWPSFAVDGIQFACYSRVIWCQLAVDHYRKVLLFCFGFSYYITCLFLEHWHGMGSCCQCSTEMLLRTSPPLLGISCGLGSGVVRRDRTVLKALVPGHGRP